MAWQKGGRRQGAAGALHDAVVGERAGRQLVRRQDLKVGAGRVADLLYYSAGPAPAWPVKAPAAQAGEVAGSVAGVWRERTCR